MKDELLLYHNSNKPQSLGCLTCLDRDVCGGLQSSAGLFDCLGLCECDDPNECQFVCRRDVRAYMRRFQEVRGFYFDDVTRGPLINHSKMPLVVPLIYHASTRQSRLEHGAVAVQLSNLFDHRAGHLKFNSRHEIEKHFGFSPHARLILDGVNKDQSIEDYWSKARARNIVEGIRSLKPDLVTTPNYSLFLNVPRWDNLHNMKRIAICWGELVAAGIPTSLHLNARTDHDWRRWTDFIVERDEVQSVTVEFGTGFGVPKRGEWLTEKLQLLAAQAGRNLQLIMRGGYKYIDILHRAFPDLVFIDTGSFVKTMKRFKLLWKPGDMGRWHRIETAPHQPLDDLLRHNIQKVSERIAYRIGEPLSSIKEGGQ